MGEDDVPPDVLVTGTARAAAENAGFHCADLPESGRTDMQGFLSHWAPDVLLWGGPDLGNPVLNDVVRREIPSILIDAGARGRMPFAGWRPGRLRQRLKGFDHVLAASDSACARLIRLGAEADHCETLGRFSDAPPAPHCNTAELADMVEIIGPRPIWLAAEVPPTEIASVLAAQRRAARLAPRLLLILVPEKPDDPGVERLLAHAPMQIARRDAGEDPEERHQVLLADVSGELGLWLRLSPVTYMGGTLSSTGHLSPFSAAALGTAIIHGPRPNKDLAEAYDGLSRAGATRMIADSDALPQAVETLLAPDRAAELAATGWEVATAGAPALNRVMDLLSALRDRNTV